ncbi:unnamed protein product [Vicia faba]|nr:unnamed protein product [Vicia faba]
MNNVYCVMTKPNGALLPKFAMLSNLKLGFVSVEVLLGLIQNAPALNTHFSRLGILKFNHELLNSAAVPDCLTSSLQVVKFGYVRGYEHELLLAKYLTTYSSSLHPSSSSLHQTVIYIQAQVKTVVAGKGDKNYRFFHNSMKSRIRCNSISMLEGNEGRVEGANDIKEAIKVNFEDFFKETKFNRSVHEDLEFKKFNAHDRSWLEIPSP